MTTHAHRQCSTLLIITGVFDKVLFEDAHEDGGQEAGQQQHRHTRVDDAEPVDLQGRQGSQMCANIRMVSCPYIAKNNAGYAITSCCCRNMPTTMLGARCAECQPNSCSLQWAIC